MGFTSEPSGASRKIEKAFNVLVTEAASFGWALSIPTEQQTESGFLHWHQFVHRQKWFAQRLRRFESEMSRMKVEFVSFPAQVFPLREEVFSDCCTSYAFTLGWARALTSQHMSLLWFYRPFVSETLRHPMTPEQASALVERFHRYRMVNGYLAILLPLVSVATATAIFMIVV